MDSKQQRRHRGDAYPMDSAWLYRQAIHYLERFESTEVLVRRVLERRIKRRTLRTGEDAEAAIEEIDAVIRRLVDLDYVDDRRFAGNLVLRLRHRGGSRAQIRARMKEKGVGEAIISASLQDDGETELRAAWIVARKRRLGPYRTAPLSKEFDLRRRQQSRELAILGRRGFSLGVARQILDASDAPGDVG